MPGVAPWTSANRTASAPCSSIIPSGSTTLPFVFDIFAPYGSRISPDRYTVSNGISPGQVDPEHDHPGDPEEQDVVAGLHDRRRVEAAEVGRVVRPAERRERPQPGAEPGVEDVGVLGELGGRPAAGLARRRAAPDRPRPSSGRRGTTRPGSGGPTTAGARRSSPGCSSASAPRSSRTARARSGSGRLRVASRAASASGPVRMNHCVLRRGSMTSLLRSQRPMTISCGRSPARSPRGVEVGDDRCAGLVAVQAVVAACRCSRSRPRRRGSTIIGRSWRRPVS